MTTTQREERGPGRPEVGEPVHVRLGGLQEAVDTFAGGRLSRAEAMRRLIEIGLSTTRDHREERHAVLDEAYEVVKDQPEGTALRWDDHLEDRLHEAVPVLAVLRHCAQASYEMDIDEHQAAHPGEQVNLLIDEFPKTALFGHAYDAAVRAYVFGRRV